MRSKSTHGFRGEVCSPRMTLLDLSCKVKYSTKAIGTALDQLFCKGSYRKYVSSGGEMNA
jgi:hypothetical protein